MINLSALPLMQTQRRRGFRVILPCQSCRIIDVLCGMSLIIERLGVIPDRFALGGVIGKTPIVVYLAEINMLFSG